MSAAPNTRGERAGVHLIPCSCFGHKVLVSLRDAALAFDTVQRGQESFSVTKMTQLIDTSTQ